MEMIAAASLHYGLKQMQNVICFFTTTVICGVHSVRFAVLIGYPILCFLKLAILVELTNDVCTTIVQIQSSKNI